MKPRRPENAKHLLISALPQSTIYVTKDLFTRQFFEFCFPFSLTRILSVDETCFSLNYKMTNDRCSVMREESMNRLMQTLMHSTVRLIFSYWKYFKEISSKLYENEKCERNCCREKESKWGNWKRCNARHRDESITQSLPFCIHRFDCFNRHNLSTVYLDNLTWKRIN